MISGGASGIGLAFATKCAGYGMSVIIAGKHPPKSFKFHDVSWLLGPHYDGLQVGFPHIPYSYTSLEQSGDKFTVSWRTKLNIIAFYCVNELLDHGNCEMRSCFFFHKPFQLGVLRFLLHTNAWTDNNGKNLAEAKSSLNGKIETIEMDVSKIEDFEKLKSKIVKEFGG